MFFCQVCTAFVLASGIFPLDLKEYATSTTDGSVYFWSSTTWKRKDILQTNSSALVQICLFYPFSCVRQSSLTTNIDYIPESQIFVSSGADRLLRFHLLPSLSFLRSRSVVAPQMAFAHLPPSNTPSAPETQQLSIPKSVFENANLSSSVAQLLTQTLTSQSQGNLNQRNKPEEKETHSDELYQKGILYSGGQGCSIHAWDIGTV